MENEENNYEMLVKNNENIFPDNAFRPDYEGQNLENNQKFQQWNNSMLKKYGNDAKLFKCLVDKIYFYTSYNEYRYTFFCSGKCPLCKKPICYYCSRYYFEDLYEYASCCLTRKIKYIFLKDTVIYINQNDQRINDLYQKYFIIFFIPVVGFIYFIARIETSFFYKLAMKNDLNVNGNLCVYKNHLDQKNKVITINIIFSFILIIPFFLINIYSILFFSLISAPFKFKPLKYIIGIIFGTFTW